MNDFSPRDLDERAASYRFQVPFAVIAGHQRLIRPEDAESRCDYVCWQCATPVRTHHNAKNIWFAHATNPDRRCHPNHHLHGKAILTLRRLLEAARAGGPPVQFSVWCSDQRCPHLVGTITAPNIWDEIAIETSVRSDADGRTLRPDLHLIYQGRVILACEVYHTHAVGEAKAARSTYPWLEFAAHQVEAIAKKPPENTYRITALNGNIGPLLDPRCSGCRIMDRPIIPRYTPSATPYVELQERLVSARDVLIHRFTTLLTSPQANGITLRGHACPVCTHPCATTLTRHGYDRVEASHTDGDFHWTLALMAEKHVALGVLLVTGNAYEGLHGPPRPATANGRRYLLIAIESVDKEELNLVTHSLDPALFSCRYCLAEAERLRQEAASLAEAERVAVETALAQEAREQQEHRDAQQKAAALRQAELDAEERLRQDIHDAGLRAAQDRAWRVDVAHIAPHFLHVLIAIWKQREHAEHERSTITNEQRLIASLIQTLLDLITQATLMPWDELRSRIVTQTTTQEAEAIVDACEQTWGQYRSAFYVALARLRIRAARLDAHQVEGIKRIAKRFEQEPPPLVALRAWIRNQAGAIDAIAAVKNLVLSWPDIPHGDTHTLTEAEHQIVMALLGWIQTIGKNREGAPWLNLLDVPALRTGLLAPKTELRSTLERTVAAL